MQNVAANNQVRIGNTVTTHEGTKAPLNITFGSRFKTHIEASTFLIKFNQHYFTLNLHCTPTVNCSGAEGLKKRLPAALRSFPKL